MAGFLLPLRIGEASKLAALLSPYAFRHSSYPALVVMELTKYITNVLGPRGLATVVATEWVEIQPVDVSSPMKKIVDAKVDVIMGTGNTTLAAAALRAEQLRGVSVPTIASPWMTTWPLARAMKSYTPWEGHMVVTGIAPTTDKSCKAWEFYQILSKQVPCCRRPITREWRPVQLEPAFQ